MRRRQFIQQGMAGVIAPIVLQGLGVRHLAASALPASTCDFNDRVLVILYNFGANDIINNTVPLSQFSDYTTHRPDIYLPESSLITLDDTLGDDKLLGLHPSLSDFKNYFYDNELLAVIQRVGYPTPNRSHFASEDIIFKGAAGTDSFNAIEDGWLGRFLMDRYPTYSGRPFGAELDPLGIILGSTPSTGFHTIDEHAVELNLSGQDPAGFYSVISSLSGEPIDEIPLSDHGDLLTYMSLIEKSTQVYSQRVTEVFDAGTNQITYPDSDLGDQMKTIARMISGGSRTKVYMARKNGWDTHVNQVVSGSTTTGKHADLLQDVNDTLKAFQEDLDQQGLSDKVLTVVFSEFTRKVVQNGSYGTDHGTISSMYIIGDHVKKGIYGNNLDLSDIDAQGAANGLQLENDYRAVWSTVLQDWLGAPDTSLQASFPLAPSATILQRPDLQFIEAMETVDPACYAVPVPPLDMHITMKLYLEGLYAGSGLHSTALADGAYLPLQQPYGSTRYNYYGAEERDPLLTGISDWILLEFRNATDIVIIRKAVLLKDDGVLVEPDGSPLLSVGGVYPEDFKIIVRHRSHVSIALAALTTAASGTQVDYDLTTGLVATDKSGQLKLVDGHWMMLAGDIDQNGVIATEDYNRWRRDPGSPAYSANDLNGDGVADPQDYDLWKANRSHIANPDLHSTLKR